MLYRFILGLFASIIFVQCGSDLKKNNIDTNIFWDIQPKSQLFTFAADSVMEIKGEMGTYINIPLGCFVFEDGTSPESTIALELKEYYSPADIIYGKQTTQRLKGMLETGGMIYINASSKDKPLKIKEGEKLEIGFPCKGKILNNAKLFRGAVNEFGYTTWNDIIRNKMVDAPRDSIVSENGTKIPFYQKDLSIVLFDSVSCLGPINCDRIFEGNNTTRLSLDIDTAIIPGTSLIFTSLKMAAGPIFENGKLTFYNIPLDEVATLVCYYKIQNKYYFFKKEFNITPNLTIRPVYLETTLDEMKKEIDRVVWQEKM